MLFSQLKDFIPHFSFQLSRDVSIEYLLNDSRKLIITNGAVFFAITGERHDGHAFINQVYEQGVRNFVVEKNVQLPPNANIIKVNSALTALQKIVAIHRKQFSIPVIGITGSNGKTIIKEWLYQLLSSKHSIVKNPGSYNSQLGLPLSVWNLRAYHTLGIFEAGISQPNEMQNLQEVLQPTIGLFTNIGSAHNEGFESLEQKIEEKLKLFQNVKCLVYCKDHKGIDEKIKNKKIPSLSWGTHADADIKVVKDKQYTFSFRGKGYYLTMPFHDNASIENCCHCIAIMLYLDYTEKEIQEGILELGAVAMRLEIKEGINQCQLIDDSYNNDLAGLQVSIDFLNNQQQKQHKALILSDILQSGVEANIWVKQVAELVQRNNIVHFIGIGKNLYEHKALFNEQASFYKDTNAFLENFREENFFNETILIKGARIFAFEKIVARLQKNVHGTVMEIDLGSMVHNLNYFKSKLNQGTKIMAMVKAFAYGSGSREVANLLQYHQVDYLGVAYADEGVELRKNNIRLPIMVMNPSPQTFSNVYTYKLEPEIYSFHILHSLLQFLNGRSIRIHIKIDSGMHRLGFMQKDFNALIPLLKQHTNLEVASIFSHLAGADESQHDDYSKTQAELFLSAANQLSEALGYKPLYHLLNSPGIIRLSQYQFDMVRLGIGLYGIDPTESIAKNLQPVATLKTIVSQVHTLHEGQTVGYGRHGKIKGEQQIATIAIGYADGYNRAFSKGTGKVYIKGKLAPVIGNVCMDMTMIDVTGLDVKEGDEVIIFGAQLPIENVAKSIHTIPYEILTNTSERVKRIFIAEGI